MALHKHIVLCCGEEDFLIGRHAGVDTKGANPGTRQNMTSQYQDMMPHSICVNGAYGKHAKK